jgi:hypothetical protein
MESFPKIRNLTGFGSSGKGRVVRPGRAGYTTSPWGETSEGGAAAFRLAGMWLHGESMLYHDHAGYYGPSRQPPVPQEIASLAFFGNPGVSQ